MAKDSKPAPKKTKPITEALSKSTLVDRMAEETGLERKQVRSVLDALENAIAGSMHKKGVGSFVLPGLFKITAQAVAAKPKRKGIDPFTKQEREFAAKPASVRVKVRPLKKLKDAAA